MDFLNVKCQMLNVGPNLTDVDVDGTNEVLHAAGERGKEDSSKVVSGAGQSTAGQAQKTVRHFVYIQYCGYTCHWYNSVQYNTIQYNRPYNYNKNIRLLHFE